MYKFEYTGCPAKNDIIKEFSKQSLFIERKNKSLLCDFYSISGNEIYRYNRDVNFKLQNLK